MNRPNIGQGHEPAYTCNGQPVTASAFYTIACDPARSVAVEACAGAGKTWMLVSRILLALLSGVKPEAILAITYTKKAAGEMRERLHDWLRGFAQEADDAVLEKELIARGVAPYEAATLVPALRGLYTKLVTEPRGVEIRTFHGWFAQLLGAAPLGVLHELGLPANYELIEDDSELFTPAWYALLQKCVDHAELKEDLDALLKEQGTFNTREALKAAWQRRMEFTLADEHGVVESSVADAPDPADTVMSEAFVQRWLRYAKALGFEKNKTPQEAATNMEAALQLQDPLQRLNALRATLFVKADNRLSKNLQKFEAAQQAEIELRPLLQQAVQRQAYVYQQRMLRLTRAFLKCYAQVKHEQGKVDMVDLERVALRLLGDTETYGWVAERLDARISQVLIDEFQDTNPLQWQALRGWFAAYAGAGGGGRLSVFIVGDPKQSIYRFRRADPAVFAAACVFIQRDDTFKGDWLACDHTRRNSPQVIGRVNELFEQAQSVQEYAGFRWHTTASETYGEVAALPPIQRQTAKDNAQGKALAWRDSLTQPRYVEEETLRTREMQQAADLIQGWIQKEGWKPSDIKVLARKKDRLRELLVELNHRGVPWRFADDVLLGYTQEVQDMTALLDVLASPMHDLSLAQVLRSPIFNIDDEGLIALAAQAQKAKRHISQHPDAEEEPQLQPQSEGQRSPHLSFASQHAINWWEVLMQWAMQSGETSEMHTNPCPANLRQAATMLQRWKTLSQSLPPHDLLDLVYNEADVLARYAQAVPTAMRDEVLANLRALLQQSLTLDGGRYATPYNLVRALRQQNVKSEYPGGGDAVELLTIHGAKGLEARGVIVLDTDPAATKAQRLSVLMDWPAESGYPKQFVFFTSHKKLPEDVKAPAQSEDKANAREELNSLYVAMTRAQEKLVFSAFLSGRQEQSWWQRLQALKEIPEIKPDTANEHISHDKSLQTVSAKAALITLQQLPLYQPVALPQQAQAWMELVRAQTGEQGVSRAAQTGLAAMSGRATPAQRFGMAVHRLLEWGQLADVHVQAVAREFGLDAQQAQQAYSSVQAIFTHEQSSRFFNAAQLEHAENEVELSYQGQIVRIDRLVKIKGQWWIVDYKSSWRPEFAAGSAYHKQMKMYKQALAALYPSTPIHTVLIAGNGEVTEV